jgi:hypothetical protein
MKSIEKPLMRPITDRKNIIKQLLLVETKRLNDIRTAALRILKNIYTRFYVED